MRKAASGHVVAEGSLDVCRRELLPFVQPAEDAGDDLLGLVFAVILDKAVEEVFACHRVIDFGFLIVIL
jgi:hypothetical protein